ncbi:methyltransferase domain-containing protein [Umezawaea endophytica]|uniref:Class I SAM-dependent methyltransferase n=1 Tax=Umezawaea endophytica TaxID=1654476 RepID=A0A9X2VMT7_9PSEU|nr:class I SAM-dependent methyltransferase [Umezawaea endophytica]MCS7479405.1 class I SAM-dependent methyltransferase [Umezawaea endophytica]
MPTLPPEDRREAHQAREVAESFGIDPERYDRARPRYPEALVHAVVAAAPGPDVLDVGTGTGIAARQFQAAGCTVSGVEVDPRMAEFARRHLDVDVSAFETWNAAGRTFDAVVSGQTWHWIDPVAGAAKAAEVLRPGGLLAVFWNVGQPPPELGAAFAEVYRRVVPDSLAARWASTDPGGYSILSAKATEALRDSGAFAEPELTSYAWERAYTRDEWLDELPTTGAHTRFPPDALAKILAGIGEAVDAAGGGFTMAYTAVAVTAVRLGPRPG